MKKLFVVIAIIFSGMLMQAQTLREVSYTILGQEGKEFKDNMRQNTNYGSLVFRPKHKNKIVSKLTVTLANDNQFYDSIVSKQDYDAKRVGTIWTDFVFEYEDVVTKDFTNLEDAKEYLNYYLNTGVEAHENAKLYKHPRKDKYVVGYMVIRRFQAGKILVTSDTKHHVINKKWEVVEI